MKMENTFICKNRCSSTHILYIVYCFVYIGLYTFFHVHIYWLMLVCTGLCILVRIYWFLRSVSVPNLRALVKMVLFVLLFQFNKKALHYKNISSQTA